MAYEFALSIDASQDYRVGLLFEYLIKRGLIHSKTENELDADTQTCSTTVTVLNRERFITYLKRKPETRELDDDNDPGDIIKHWRELNVVGKASPTSREGRIAAARKRNARADIKLNKNIVTAAEALRMIKAKKKEKLVK